MQVVNLLNFEYWLSSQEEFDIIVDGANVAYTNQNHASGQFRFQQIELIVNTLEQNYKDKRILVIIPFCYIRKVIPNRTRPKKYRKKFAWESKSTLQEDDRRILDNLMRRNMLYVVPNGANDDWYWLLSTIYKNRSPDRPGYVVTNDMMKDHKISFENQRLFQRWRMNAIIHFRMRFDEEKNMEQYAQILLPDTFTYEMQQSSRRKHIPSVDERLWLCLENLSNQK